MNKVGIENKAGLIFWGSLVCYSLTFGGFYFYNQFSLGSLEKEIRNGQILNSIKDEFCQQTKGCKQINYLPYLSLNEQTGKYKAMVQVETISKSDFDVGPLNSKLNAQRVNLPWYVNMRLDSIDVAVLNGNKLMQVKQKPEWYKSIISMFG